MVVGFPRVLSIVLDENLPVQTIRVPVGAQAIGVDYNPDQPRLQVFGDPEQIFAEAFRVYLLPENSPVGRLRKEWFRGQIRTNKGRRLTVLVEPLAGGGIENYGPLVWAGAWDANRDYTLEEIVTTSVGLFRCWEPIGADVGNAEPGVDSGWEDNWQAVLLYTAGDTNLGNSDQVLTGNRSVGNSTGGYWLNVNLTSAGKTAIFAVVPSNPSVSLSANDGAGNVGAIQVGSTGIALTLTGTAVLSLNGSPGTSGHPIISQGAGASPIFGQLGSAGIANDAVTTLKIVDDAVDNIKLSNMAEATIKGRAAGAGTGDPTDLTAAQVRTLINVEDGATGDQTPAEILAALLTVDGAGTGLDADLLDGQSGAYYLAWANLTGVPSTFTPAAHTLDSHSNVTITSNSAGEILKWNGSAWINNTLAEAGISAVGHTHATGDITSGTFADGRIAASNVTQHISSILTSLLTVDGAGTGLDADLLDGQHGSYYLAWANLTGVPSTFTPAAHTLDSHSNVTITSNSAGEILKWNGSAWINNTLAEAGIAAVGHTHATSDVTSGTFADARIAASNVTQHISSILTSLLTVDGVGTGLDADLLDGQHGSYYLAWANLTGVPSSFTPAAHTLDSHSNVTITANSAGEILKWNGSAWINNTLAEADIASAATLASHVGNTSNPHSVTKAQVGLSNVENTALSTWAGSANITTVGTLSAGAVPWSLLTGVPGSFTPSAHTLDSHSNVTITSNSAGEILKWNGSAWINNTLAEAGISAVGHTHATSDVTSGTFADARIAATNVTQHISSILTSLLTVDGAGTGLDADLLDGQHGSYYLAFANFTGTASTSQIANDAIDNTKLSNMAEATIKGRAAGAGTGDPTDLTAAQLLAILLTVDGASSGLDADLLDGQSGAYYLAWANLTGVPGSFTPAAHTLDSHSNVTITSNSAGEILKWNGSAWINNTLAEADIASAATLASHVGNTSNPHSVTKAQVGLANVENTALSTWAGSANITTVGTLSAGAVPWSLLTGVPGSFTPAAHTLDSHSNVTITANSAGEILKWNGSAWINNTLAEAGISAVGHTHATGDITSGTFADARIAASNVTQHISSILTSLLTVDGAGTGLDADLLDGQQGSYYLAWANLTGVPGSFTPAAHTLDSHSNVTITANSAGEILKWNGSAWINNTLAEADIASATTLSGHTSNTSNPHSVTKAQVGLANVENTALSTWAGSANITTIGTLSAGTVPWARLSSVPSPTVTVTLTGAVTGSGAGTHASLGNATASFATTIAANAVGTTQLAGAATFAESGLVAGWYTIAYNTGSRASARFILRDTTAGYHGTVVFLAAHFYGDGNQLVVLENSRFSTRRFTGLRIKSAGTYNGALLQVELSGTGDATFDMLENFQANGWVAVDWLADGVDPGGMGDFAAVNASVEAEVDLSLDGPTGTIGALVFNTDLYLGSATTQHLVWHAGNDGAGSTLDADLLDGQQGSYYLAFANFTGTASTSQIANDAIDNTKLSNMAQATIKGRAAGAGTGDPTDLTAAQLLAILLTVDGASSGLDADLLDGQSGAYYNAWANLTGVPSTFTPAAHTLDSHSNVTITSNSAGEILKWNGSAWINNTLAEAGISAVGHTHATGDITSGTFADARIAASNVTQHISSILTSLLTVDGAGTGLDADLLDGQHGSYYLAWANLTGVPGSFTPAAHTLDSHSNVTITSNSAGEILKWNGSAWINNTLAEAGIAAVGHTHATGDITSGTFADGRIAASNVTQHISSILTSLLTVDGAGTGLDADLLDGQHGSYYQSASNLNAGTLDIARIGDGTITAAKLALSMAPTWGGVHTFSVAPTFSQGIDVVGTSASVGWLGVDYGSTHSYFPFVGGGAYENNSASNTGAIAIKTPVASYGDDAMVTFWVDVLDYSSHESFSVFVAGYQYSGSPAGQQRWVSPTSAIIARRGASTTRNHQVTFATSTADDRHIVYIGTTASTWDYVKVQVRDVHVAHSGAVANWRSGWAIALEASALEAGPHGGNITQTDNLVLGYVETAAQVASDVIDNTKLSDMAQATIKGRASGAGTGDPTDLTAAQLLAILLTVDGASSGLDADLLDGQSGAYYLAWANLTGVPGSFTPAAHTLDSHSNVTITANSSGEILKWNGSAWINNTLAEAGISAVGHTHATSDVTSGTFADARIAASNVTQHISSILTSLLTVDGAGTGLDADLLDGQQGSYYLAWANLTGVPGSFTPSAHTLDSHSNVTITSNSAGEILKWNGSAWINNTLAEAGISAVGHTHATSDVTSGTFADARIAATNVTQHISSILTSLLTVDGAGTGLDADLLDGQHGSYYQSASNLNAGTLAFARLDAANDTGGEFPISDRRALGDVSPDSYRDKAATFSFTDDFPTLGSWGSALTMKGWSDGYYAWQIMSYSSTAADSAKENLFFRTGVSSTWNTLRKVWDSGNDGSGSGLDADTLDTYEASAFPRKAEDATISGAWSISGSSLSFGSSTRQMLNLWSTSFALGVQANTLYARSASRFSWFIGGVYSGTENDPGAGGSVGMTLDSSANLAVTGTVQGTRLISTQATGTAPLTVSSTTVVTNLNADLLDGQQGTYYLAWANLTGVPSTFTPAAHTLDSHSNVTITSNSAGEILKWNGSAWINNTLAEAGISAVGHTHATGDITSGTFADARIAASNVTQHISSILTSLLTVDGAGTGLDADLLDGVQGANYTRVDLTFLGSTGNVALDSVTNTAGEWSSLPVGYARMMSSGIGTAGGAPLDTYGYFLKVANRDTAGGWGGLWAGYAAGQNYIGRAADSTVFATWDLLWSSANDGAGSGLDADLLDGQQGSYYLAWANLTGVPGSFTPSAHTLDSHSNVTITSNTSGEILKWNGSAWINNTLAEAGISAVGHTHATGDITSGTFADARIAASNVTQHISSILTSLLTVDGAGTGLDADLLDGQQGTYYLAWANLTGVPSTFTPAAHTLDSHSNVTITSNSAGEILKWNGSAWINNTLAEAGISAVGHTHATGDITSGTFADARIAASNVTQHISSILTSLLTVDGAGTGLDADLLDGQHGTYYLAFANFTGTASTSQIANDAVDNTKLANMAQATIKGRASGAGTGDPTDLTAAQLLAILLTVDGASSGLDADLLDAQSGAYYLAFANFTGTASTAQLADNAVSNAKIRDSAALSVIGRSANSTGDPADIAASVDGYVLRRSGTTLDFGQVATAGLADQAVTTDKLYDFAVSTIKIQDGAITADKIDGSDAYSWTGSHKFVSDVCMDGVVTWQNASQKLATNVTVTTDNASAIWFDLKSGVKTAGLLLYPLNPSITFTANDGAGNYGILGVGSTGFNFQLAGTADIKLNGTSLENNEVIVGRGAGVTPARQHLCPPIRYSWTDFPSPNNTQVQDPYFGTALASGVQSASPGATFLVAGVLGLCMIRSSSTTNSGFSWLTTNIDRIVGQADLYFRCILAIADDMTSKTVRLGFLDSADHNAPTDGTYFELVAGSLSCAARSANNSARSSHGTTFTLTANTFYVFEIYWTSTSSIKYTIKSLDEATTHLDVDKTTDIPTGTSRTFGAGLIATSTILATDDLLVVDYMGHGFKNRR